ncbi:MAG: PfkB family carbohydrate kinase [Flavobacteriaceae bacterium]|nr:PfkB family carbohydrate kinase [Flavobacteriaceae bacterium]
MILCVCPNPAIDKFIYIDNFKIGKVNRIDKELSYPGGKGIHVAIGVKELGEEVAILSFWGGATGKWIKQECEAKGIICYGPEVEDLTRTCLIIKSNNESNETEILGVGPIIGEKEYNAFFQTYEELLKKTKLVSMSGSWPQNSIGANYSQFIEKANDLNIKSFIDCSGSLLVDALKKNPYLVHINHHEGYDIYKSNNPVEISLKLNNICKITAVTYGEKGLYLYDGKELVHALSKVENVISAVGSGDSLMAGLIVAHQRDYNFIETAKLAAASGAANCIRKDLGMFYKEDVERLFKNCDVHIKQLN